MASKKNQVEPAGGLQDVEGDLDLVDQELRAQEEKVKQQEQKVKQQEQKVAEEKRKEEEKKKQDAERKAQEDKRKKEEQDKKKREEEEKKKKANKQADDQQKKAEDERKKAENDRKKAEDDRKNAEKDVKKKEEQLEKDKKKAEDDKRKKEEDLEKKKRDLEAQQSRDAETRRARQQTLEKDIGSRETAMVGAAAALETAKTKAKTEDEKREKEIKELKDQEKKFKDEEKKMKSERNKVAKERKKKTPSAATSCSMKMAKWSIVAFNALFILGGLALFGFGLYLRFDEGTRSLLGNADQADLASVSSTSPFFMMTYGLMGLGLFITAVCCLGLFGALKENDLLLFIFAIITLLLACGLLAMGIIPLASRQVLFVDTLSGFVTDLVQTDYGSSSSARTVMDWIQEQLSCCGSTGPSSWTTSTWVNSSANTNNAIDPDSCYSDQAGRAGQFSKGCIDAIEDYADSYFLYIGVALIVLAVILLVCVSCAFTFCSRIRTFRKHGHSADLLEMEAKHKKQTKEMAKLKKELDKLKKQQTV